MLLQDRRRRKVTQSDFLLVARGPLHLIQHRNSFARWLKRKNWAGKRHAPLAGRRDLIGRTGVSPPIASGYPCITLAREPSEEIRRIIERLMDESAFRGRPRVGTSAVVGSSGHADHRKRRLMSGGMETRPCHLGRCQLEELGSFPLTVTKRGLGGRNCCGRA